MLRRLLVGSANYILGPFAPDSDLRRHGEKLMATGGRRSRKRAVVAVARKLSVLLHSLWSSGEVYEPLRNYRPSASEGPESESPESESPEGGRPHERGRSVVRPVGRPTRKIGADVEQ
ncbi:MAG: hypothetical protein ACRDSJ_20460 [Rubrobacteraceae bacterium]